MIFLWGRAQTFQDSSGVTTMNFVVTLIQFLFAAAHLSTVKTASINKEVDKSKNEVIPFIDVYNKSSCQPREKLVEIPSEYPGDTEHTYVPSSVVLKRCGGCCSDEAMECVPTETRNTTLQVMRLRPMVSQHLIQLSFTEHQKCECRDKTDVTAKKEYHCVPCSERRKRLFVQDPLTCKCSCKFTQLDCKSRQLELNERSCRCERPRR
ncbi:vascular endothelial growth factor A-A isoform X1 [Xyrichtys novacula]|uniref:Vascular endothelial growth factor A-A isoform X1 n=1 Tax=Xyrichtys novacula TaxID=13765 RepID=A0AAV1FLM8_XYRNO|nr:vascular endothelial growth factor A-A isoform X1 [Xyrichtys novacula]